MHDIDVLREHLGTRQINILAYSYGSRVGALYANYFPKHLRALVLDSPAAPQTLFKAMLLATNDAKAKQDLWLLEKTGLAQNATMQKLLDLETEPEAHSNQSAFDVLAWARNYQRHPDWAKIIRVWRQHATFGYQVISEPALTPAVLRSITRILAAEIDSILNSATASAAQKTQMLRFVVRFWFGLDANQAKAYSAWLPAQAPTLLAEVRLLNASFELTLCNDFPEFEPDQHLYNIDGLADLCQGWRRQSALQRPEAKMSARVLIVGNALDARTPKLWHAAWVAQWPHAYRIEVDSSIEHGATFQGQRWLDPEEPLGLDALASAFLLHAETPEQIPWPEESSKHLAFAPLQKEVGAISNHANASHAYWQQIKVNWIEMRSRLKFLVTALEAAEIE